MTTERPPVHDRCRFRAAGFWPAALAACLLVGSVRAAPIAPRAATLGTAEALRWIGQASPGGVAVSTTLLGGGPTPCLSRGGALVTFDSAWKARVTEAPDDALILTYRIHREVDGFWRERQFGVAVVHAGRLVWAVESEAAFSFRGLPCGLVSLRAGEPLAIRLSYEFTADPVAPRLALRRERIFAFLDGAFRQVLDDTTDVDAHGRFIDVVYGYGVADDSGWSVIAKAAAEAGSTRTCEFTWAGDRYVEQLCTAASAHPGIAPLVIPGPVVIDGPELCFNLHASPGLPLLASLDTVDAVVAQPGHWPGPATTQVRLYGGWRSGHGDLILHFWVKTPSPPTAGWADSCELWLWDGRERLTRGWAFSPGDFASHRPAVRQLFPEIPGEPAGLAYDARRHADGYSLVVELDAVRMALDRSAAGRYRLCLVTRFGGDRTQPAPGCVMATSRTFRHGDPSTYNPLAFHRVEQLDITKGWIDAEIVGTSADGRRVTARNGGRITARPGGDGDLMLNLTAASHIRTLHGTAIPVAALRPGDGAEIGYHYAEGVRVVDWLRPYEKTMEGIVTSIDVRNSRVGFRDHAGIRRMIFVPATAGKPSYDDQALADLASIRVGDEVTVWYVGPPDAASVERIGARTPLRAVPR